jgi:hypothetical protein
VDKPSPARPAPLFAEQENVHVTEAEWLKLLGRVPNFHAVADLDSLADRIMQTANRWDRPLAAAFPDWTVTQITTAAIVYAGALAAAGAAGDLDVQLRTLYSGWDDSVVEVVARQARWPEHLDPAVAERLAADTRPMLVDTWHLMRESTYLFGNPFIGAQVSIPFLAPLEEDDLQYIIDSLEEQGFVAQHISPQGAGGPWVVALHWLGADAGQLALNSFLVVLAGRLWKRFRAKGKTPPDQIVVYKGLGSEKLTTYDVKEPKEADKDCGPDDESPPSGEPPVA